MAETDKRLIDLAKQAVALAERLATPPTTAERLAVAESLLDRAIDALDRAESELTVERN